MKQVPNTLTRLMSHTMPTVDRATSSIMVHVGSIVHYHHMLTRLTRHPDSYVRILITNKRTREATKYLLCLAADNDEQVRVSLARSRKKLPGEVLAMLATDPNEKVRTLVASRREELPIPIYYALMRENNMKIKAALAGNKFCSLWVLEQLAKDDSSIVVESLKNNPSLPYETQTYLFLKK